MSNEVPLHGETQAFGDGRLTQTAASGCQSSQALMPAEPLRFESWIERQVREAIERGEFDNLPGAGQPLKMRYPGAEDWWLRQKLEDEDLRDVMPGPLALRRQKQDIQQTLEDVRNETEAREIIEDLNARIRQSNVEMSTTPRIITALLEVRATLERWRAAQARDGSVG